MKPPESPPDKGNLDAWEAYALSTLAEHLGEAAPSRLAHPVLFPHSPLAGEGPVVVYEFMANRGDQGDQRYYVVVGQTEPNYYFAYDLSVEEAYELHLGTRFMLVMGVARVDAHDQGDAQGDDYDPLKDARHIVDRVAPESPIEEVQVAATFDVDGHKHAVLRCRIAGEPVYIMARDAPPGFSRRVSLPPQVAYRMHIGHTLRTEPQTME